MDKIIDFMFSCKILIGPLTLMLFLFGLPESKAQPGKFSNWETDLSKKAIDLAELRSGGPPKDGIPSVDNPHFTAPGQASSWIKDREPVIALVRDDTAKAYPLQILIWHEIVNDRINGEPVAVTFCPLCYSALVFNRVVGNKTLEFGVSGFLRKSDLVMYDRSTESLWQQFTGKGIVGHYTGTELEQLPAQIISFGQFKEAYPDGAVLSRNTGHPRNYGSNPYPGYDDIDNTPFMLRDLPDTDIPPMEKVIGVKLNASTKTYPYSVTRDQKVINDTVNDSPIVLFHIEGATSALDDRQIAESKESGSTGVFKRSTGGRTLTFTHKDGQIIDNQTGSAWNIAGRAVEGELEGTQLAPVTYGDYFAFAWLTFRPDTRIYEKDK